MTDFPNLEIEATLILNYFDVAAQIEINCAEYLLPAPKGIYVRNRLEPAMVDGKTYYVLRGGASEVVTDINQVKDNVYDENQRVVIPKTFWQRKGGHAFVSNEPFIPYRGAKILELAINQLLESFTRYRRWPVDFDARILEHMYSREACQYPHAMYESEVEYGEKILDLIQDAIRPLKRDVAFFLGNADWNLYHVELRNSNLVLERYMDWRAYQWEQEHGEHANRDE